MRHVILNFHGIGEPGRPLEDGEAPYWISQEFYGDILALCDHYRDRVDINFTFDDGNKSDLSIGAEGLAKFGFTAQFFVLSSRLDTLGSLSSVDLLRLQEMGNSIGNHGADHVDWRGLDPNGVMRELVEARKIIEDAAQCKIAAAGIPFGDYNRFVLQALKAHDYDTAYCSYRGAWHAGQHPIPRNSPRNDMSLADIENRILGPEPLSQRIRRSVSMARKRWN
jgi:peptidoglycan/xylan/chitin deacetylase (PgdA/CDA1 family)